MEACSVESGDLWPLALYFGLVLFVLLVMLGVPALLGPKHMGRETGEPYEAGIAAAGSARARVDVKFYLVAMFFVIFDLEAVFLFSWAVAARELGWPGYFEMLVFVGVLVAGLVYIWRVGALDWHPRPRRIPRG
ncbi:MAG TPA: NADH-quinone oxidoreductase subunit A [Chloroflexota bacterium]|nr:NADH-quinone oxidoreductase subunit A [Chloroflexota bacterium]